MGEASREGLWSKALHSTFNVLVGAQPVPSIECSLSKLEQTQRHSGEQGAASSHESPRHSPVRRSQAPSARILTLGTALLRAPTPSVALQLPALLQKAFSTAKAAHGFI